MRKSCFIISFSVTIISTCHLRLGLAQRIMFHIMVSFLILLAFIQARIIIRQSLLQNFDSSLQFSSLWPNLSYEVGAGILLVVSFLCTLLDFVFSHGSKGDGGQHVLVQSRCLKTVSGFNLILSMLPLSCFKFNNNIGFRTSVIYTFSA